MKGSLSRGSLCRGLCDRDSPRQTETPLNRDPSDRDFPTGRDPLLTVASTEFLDTIDTFLGF